MKSYERTVQQAYPNFKVNITTAAPYFLTLSSDLNEQAALPVSTNNFDCVNFTKEENSTMSANLYEIDKCLEGVAPLLKSAGDKIDPSVANLYEISIKYLYVLRQVQTQICPPKSTIFNGTSTGVTDISNHVNIPNLAATGSNWTGFTSY